MSTAHNQTNKILSTSEKQLNKAYTDGYKDLKKQIAEIYNKIDLSSDNANVRLSEANKYDRLNKLVDIITEEIAKINAEQTSNINTISANVYQLNYNDVVNALREQGIDIDKETKAEAKAEAKEKENPYNKIAIDNAKDKTQISGKVRSSLLDAIIGGAGVLFLFKGIKQVFENNLKSQLRILETTATNVENQAIISALGDANNMAIRKGYEIVKVWNTVDDDRVRTKHARADGQEVPLNQPFYVGGEQLMHPCDINGSAGNVINCRCYLTYKIVKV